MSIAVKKWVYLIVLSLIWGSSYILIKKGLIGLTPIQLGSIRILFTTSILALIGYKSLKGLTIKQWKWLVFTGFVGTFFPSFLFAFSETEIDSSVVAVLNGLTPLFSLLFAALFFHQSVKSKQLGGVLVGFVGTILLVVQEFSLTSTGDGRYALLVVLAAICYGINVNALKYKLQGVAPMAIALANFVAISIPALILLLTSNFQWETFYTDEKILSSLWYIFILSLVGTAFAKVLFNELLSFSTAVFSISITYLLPIVAIAWGVLDGEQFGGLQWVASGFILCGIYLVTETKKAP
ncbi:EamA family transporter [Flavobacteriaceae bacterium]|nr:EamA family transporter [Flavobacteriaceae bacterium]